MAHLRGVAAVHARRGVRTVPEHFQWMKNHIREYSRPDAPGFVKQGEKDGVVYELHTEKTREGGGAGYFRLTAEIELDPLTFVALMGAPHKLFAMDDTVRVMDFERSPKYPSVKGKNKLWLAYFRQAPGGILPDLDGIDLSGWEVAEDGSVLQASMGLPKLLPEYPGKWYPSAFRSLDMYWGYSLLPLAGGRSKLVLICQHDLQNWMVPHYFANKMVGDVLADYVRTAERVGQGLVQTGKAAALRERHGL